MLTDEQIEKLEDQLRALCRQVEEYDRKIETFNQPHPDYYRKVRLWRQRIASLERTLENKERQHV